MAKNISPQITKLSGLADIGLITSLREKIDQKLTFFFRNHENFGLLGKIASRGEHGQNFSLSNYA